MMRNAFMFSYSGLYRGQISSVYHTVVGIEYIIDRKKSELYRALHTQRTLFARKLTRFG